MRHLSSVNYYYDFRITQLPMTTIIRITLKLTMRHFNRAHVIRMIPENIASVAFEIKFKKRANL